jgi:hypothetical protein
MQLPATNARAPDGGGCGDTAKQFVVNGLRYLDSLQTQRNDNKLKMRSSAVQLVSAWSFEGTS